MFGSHTGPEQGLRLWATVLTVMTGKVCSFEHGALPSPGPCPCHNQLAKGKVIVENAHQRLRGFDPEVAYIPPSHIPLASICL